MKKVGRGVILGLLVGCFLYSAVEAKEIYYTNDVGVEMTELEYDKMTQIYSERYIDTMSQEEFDALKNGNIVDSGAIYQKTTYAPDGKVLKDEYVSEEEYNQAPSTDVSQEGDIMPYDYKYIETSYKKLSGTLIDIGNRKYSLIGGLSWKKVPLCRSYDVFAYRFMHFDFNGFGGTQNYYVNGVSNKISYDTSSPGYKQQGNGAGVSMNLVDGSNITGYELAIGTNLTVNTTNYTQAHAYVSYQHAQSDLTREQSLGYTLNVAGLGNVILFNSSTIAAKYDGMSGVHLTAQI